uniref:Olfactomedin-like 2Ba n=1 Tax=Labrus bergylta TaxID=56723 RepID=A0A3Q3FUD2_9LABR
MGKLCIVVVVCCALFPRGSAAPVAGGEDPGSQYEISAEQGERLQEETDDHESILSKLLGDYDKVKALSEGSDCRCKCVVRPLSRSACRRIEEGSASVQDFYTVETISSGPECKCACIAPPSAVNPCEGEFRLKKLREAGKGNIKLTSILELLEGSFYGMDLLKLHSITTKLMGRVEHIEKVHCICHLSFAKIGEYVGETKAHIGGFNNESFCIYLLQHRAALPRQGAGPRSPRPKKTGPSTSSMKTSSKSTEQKINEPTSNNDFISAIEIQSADLSEDVQSDTSVMFGLTTTETSPVTTLRVSTGTSKFPIPLMAESTGTPLSVTAKDTTKTTINTTEPSVNITAENILQHLTSTNTPTTGMATSTVEIKAIMQTNPSTTAAHSSTFAPKPATEASTTSPTSTMRITTQAALTTTASSTAASTQAAATTPDLGIKSTLSPRECKDTLATISQPVTHNTYGRDEGAWMKDPKSDDNKIYVTNFYYGNNLLEFKDLEVFKGGRFTNSYKLPYNWIGTGHVVYNGAFYYNRAFSRDIIKFDLRLRYVAAWTMLHDALIEESSVPWEWRSHSDVDFAVDESGLWIIYPALDDEGFLQEVVVLSQLNPSDLSMQRETTWRTGLRRNHYGNCFIVCGVLYAVDSHNKKEANLEYAFDTHTNTQMIPRMPFTNNYTHTTQIDYNPKEGVLYAWDNGHQVTYDIKFAFVDP